MQVLFCANVKNVEREPLCANMQIEARPIASFPARMGLIAQRVGRPGLFPREPGP